MGLFNQQTQYTADVSQANNQVMSQASESGAYMAGLIEADATHRLSNSKLIDELGPLLSSYGKIQKNRNKRLHAEAESELYEQDGKLSDTEYRIKHGEERFDNADQYEDALRAQELTGVRTESEPGGNVIIAQALAGADSEEANVRKRLMGKAEMIPEWTTVAGANVTLERADGSSFNRDSAKTLSEYLAAERLIRNIWFEDAMDGTSGSQRRRYLHKKMRTAEKYHRDNWISAQRTAVKSITEDNLQNELVKTIQTGTFSSSLEDESLNPFTQYIKKTRGWYGGEGGDKGQTRKEVYDIAIAATKAGTLKMTDIQKLGNSWFTADDGSRQQVKKYFKKDHARLLAAGVQAATAEIEARNGERNTDVAKWWLDKEDVLANQEGPVTNEQLDELEEEFNSNPQWRGRTMPEGLQKYRTLQDEQDEAIKNRIIQKAADLIPIDQSELAGISDSAMKLQLMQQLKISNLSALDKSQRDNRDEDITTHVGEKLREMDAEKTKSSKYNYAVRGATAHFNREYSRYVAENPDNKEGAYSKAWESTLRGIRDGTWENYVPTPMNDATSVNVSKTYDAISKNPGIINEAVLPAVTSQDLKDGLKAIRGEGPIPAIFYDISRRSTRPGAKPLDPWKVTLAQVNAGLRAEGEKEITDADDPQVTKDMEKALSQRQINEVSKGPAGLNKVLKESDNIKWFLDNVKDGAAMRNGGYDYILSPTGGDAHLEKPLTQHTIGEALELMATGHGNLTAYAMSPAQFMRAVEASGLGIDDILNEETQDTLAAYTAMVSIKHRNDLTGFYGTNEIERLSPEDREQMSSIAGTAPSDWNKLENLVSRDLH